MAVNRALRTQVAENLAAFMRGEITNFECFRRGEALYQAHAGLLAAAPASAPAIDEEKDVDDHALQVAVMLHLPKDRQSEGTISVSRETWEQMRRELAFMETDLEIVITENSRPAGCCPRVLLLTLLMCGILATALYPVLGLGFWFFAVLWISVFPVGFLAAWLSYCPAGDVAAPFDSVEQWEAHKALTERFALPEYDPAVHCYRKRWLWHRALRDTLSDPRAWLVLLASPLLVVLVGALLLLPGPFAAFSFIGLNESHYAAVVATQTADENR